MSDQQSPTAPPFPPEWKSKFVNFIKDKVGQSALCRECGEPKVAISDDIVAPPAFHGGGFVFGGPSYPQVMLVCTHCGNTRYFNAVIAGLVEGQKLDDKS